MKGYMNRQLMVVKVMLKMLLCRNDGAAKSGLPRPLQVRGANVNNHVSDNQAFGSTKSTQTCLAYFAVNFF
jgi:hypothetical protein